MAEHLGPPLQLKKEDGPHFSLRVAVAGIPGTGVHEFIDRQTGLAGNSDDHSHWQDPRDNYHYISVPLTVDDVPVRVQWHPLKPPNWKIESDFLLSLGQAWLRECDATVFIYNCVDYRSLQALSAMYDAYVVQQERANSTVKLCKQFWVICNRIDVYDQYETRRVPMNEGESWSTEIGASFRKVSARTGEGFDTLGQSIAKAVVDARGIAPFTAKDLKNAG